MKQPNITIVDYGVGNTRSVANAIYALGYCKVMISGSEVDIRNSDALILPGVGAFAACAKRLRDLHLDTILHEVVLARKKPILGICVGMQLMATASEEGGFNAGLDWISGNVVRLELPSGYSVPPVGWNDVISSRESVLFSRISGSQNFYFDHSYHYKSDPAFVSAECDYGIRITSAISKDNIHGVQFHPEKSHNNGLKVFRGFFNFVNSC